MNNSHFHELRKREDEEKKRKAAEIEKAKWTGEQEALLAEWAEKADCYRWLHSRAEKYYRFRNYLFTIPLIFLYCVIINNTILIQNMYTKYVYKILIQNIYVYSINILIP